jgi:hypothetical protein
VPYKDVRDQFLATADTKRSNADEAAYFAQIGLFVFDRWQQIAADYGDGEDIDEEKSDARWDECTSKDVDGYRQQAATLIQNVAEKDGASAFLRTLWKNHMGWMVLLNTLAWIAKTVAAAIVGAIGLILFGTLLLSLAPTLAQSVRSTLDDFIPLATETDGAIEGESTE